MMMNHRPMVTMNALAGGPRASARGQHGASMLEVLVSLLVISFGLLGVAGMSAATFGHNKSAQVRLSGLALANDYADRARVNVYGYDLGDYSIDLAESEPASVTFDAATIAANDADPKTAAESVAQFDRRYFMQAVAARLPQGKAVVVSNPQLGTSDRGMDIWLLWKEPSADDGDSDVLSAAKALFQAGQDQCPSGVQESDSYSCMYFRVGL